MKPITREELDRWKQLAEAATAGPWNAVLKDDSESYYPTQIDAIPWEFASSVIITREIQANEVGND
jgi:hypothetical protein